MTNITPPNGMNTPPQLWKLDKNGKPKDSKKLTECIRFLASKPGGSWVSTHGKEAKLYFALLDKTVILSKEGKGVHKVLLERYPKLFGRVLIDFNGVKHSIPQARLTEQSEKFNRMLSGGFKKEKSGVIVFKNESYDKKIVSHFLQYLETGKIELDGDNLLAFFCLADEHLLPELSKLCSKFLAESLSVESLTGVLESGVELNIPDIQWGCLAFACNNIESLEKEFKNKKLSDKQQFPLKPPLRKSSQGTPEKRVLHPEISTGIPEKRVATPRNPLPIPLGKILQRELLSDETKEILELAKECSENNIVPLTEKGYRTIKLKSFEAAKLATLEKLNNKIGVTGLKISGDNVNSGVLEKLTEKIPVLNYLFIKNSKVESIPKKWLNKLEEINCGWCPVLTRLTAPEVKEIYCSGCEALSSLTAPKAEKIYCRWCPVLTRLTVPEAKKINCIGCEALTSFTASEAKEIYCSGCKALPSLTAPKAEKIYCRWCCELTSLTAPKAETIYCSDCEALPSLSAPKAEKIDCHECKALTSLTAPKAKEIDCHECKALTSLTAPKAKEIDCHECKALTSLTAPKAKIIR